jgi:gliding motility-associated-like protein
LAIYSYVWRDVDGNTIGKEDNLNVTSGGNYTVTATTTNGTNCGRTRTITVTESNPAILLNSFVTIVDEGNNIGSKNNLSIMIDAANDNLGPGDYQFALRNDDENTTTLFQDEPLFENLEGGIYTIIANDKNGCAPDAKLQISVLQFPKFFTPNGDGKNDTWVIKGANKTFYPNSSINIFNRFGKLVAQIPIDGQGWNGTYNSKILPSNDYWYTITLIPADISKTTINKTGNFSLIRK